MDCGGPKISFPNCNENDCPGELVETIDQMQIQRNVLTQQCPDLTFAKDFARKVLSYHCLVF